jgi:hypothetical protein
MLKEKDRSILFVMIQERIKKRAKVALKEPDLSEVCDYADDLIEDTYAGTEPSREEVKQGLLILKELI